MPEQTYQYYLNQKTVAAHYLELGNVSKALEHFINAYQTPFGIEDLDLMLELAFLYDEVDEQKNAIQLFYDMIMKIMRKPFITTKKQLNLIRIMKLHIFS